MIQDVKSFISGGLSGMAQVLIMQPFQIIKVRQVNEPDNSIKYHGFVKSIKTILKEEGMMTFYKGTRSPLIGYGLQCSWQFGFNRFFRHQLSKINGKQQDFTLLVASVLTGIPSALAITPADHLRILMQKDVHGFKQTYKGQLQAARDIVKRHGIKGLYLGFNTTFVREIVAMGFFFTCFQKIKQMMEHDRRGSWRQKVKLMLAGGVAGLGSWIFTYPLDFIKTKIQSQDLDNKEYKGLADCFKKNLQEHGGKVFTRGLVTVCIRSFPVNAVGFLVQDEVGVLLNRKEVD